MFVSDIIKLHDKLTGALIGLARATENNEHLISASTDNVVLEGLFATNPTSSMDEKTLELLIQKVDEEKKKMVPNCYSCAAPCGRTANYNMENLWNETEDIRTLKSRILFGIRKIASNSYPTSSLEYTDSRISLLLYRALYTIGMDSQKADDFLPIIKEIEEFLNEDLP